ncbi:hypothetical protein OUZ56_032713 [Daphnia magna]|uniref:Uncharacterized protein n=1 Tax=Daphnia magna TaxID=35525 RepID=A0ABQ9ZWY1_9CRUS|nr:hypothetical protein OUZ56_032713 [Daphnia magna]
MPKRVNVLLKMPPVRIGTRKRVAKVFGDFVDASFSESEPPSLHKIPSPPNVNKSIHGHQSRRRPPKSAKKSNDIQTSQELCNAGTRKDSGNTPVFPHTQQTSQDTAIWSFSDRSHSTLGDEELLPMGPRETQYHGTSNGTTMSYDRNSEPELAECHAPDNQLGLNYFRQLSSQHQQPHIQPGPSSEMNSRQQSSGHGGRGGGTLQHQLNLPDPSSGKNLWQQKDTSFFDAAETQAFRTVACNGNMRPQLSEPPRHTASEVSTQDFFGVRSSNKEILRQPRNLNEIPNAVFQDYVKRTLDFLKFPVEICPPKSAISWNLGQSLVFVLSKE